MGITRIQIVEMLEPAEGRTNRGDADLRPGGEWETVPGGRMSPLDEEDRLSSERSIKPNCKLAK